MKKIFTIIIIILSLNTYAQNLPKFSNYEMNKNIINPAAIFDNNPTINIFYRNQWMGFEDAPTTAGFNATYKNDKSAFGVYLLNDNAGIFHQNIFQLNYSYSLQVTDETYMNFGLSGGFNIYSMSFQDLILHDINDPYIPVNQESAFLPDINFGTIYTNIRNTSDFAFSSLARRYPIYYIGFSVQHLLGVVSNNIVAKDNSYMNRHYNLMGGIMHPVGASFQLQELILIKYTPNAPFQADIGAKFFYQENYWFGLSYRTSNDLIAKIGFKFNFVSIGYAFDFSIFQIPSKTSHDIVLGFIIPYKNSTSKY
ncbi:MAG: PorP/SprF family type IX secretion system membrane protein [Bacteroidales bacterium]|nr:PorP/SprF family type IX secretion system membrane protein [Bacteroidales bacterium]